MTILKNFLIKNRASRDVFDYAKDMTLEQFYHNCERGDDIIYLFTKTNPSNIKELVLTAAHYTNACRHLLKDERSLKAIDVAFNFESYSEVQLYEICRAAADAAWSAARTAAADAAYAAARAADAAFYLANYVVYAAAIEKARAARTTAYVEYADAWTGVIYAADALKNSKLIADIVKKHLPLKLWNQEIINN